MRIWSISLIQSDLKWCIHLSRSLYLYCNGSADLLGRETSEQFKMKINVSAEYRTSNPLISSRIPKPLGHRDRSGSQSGRRKMHPKSGRLPPKAVELTCLVDYLCFKLLQYSEVTGNAWDVSKHVEIQLIKVLKFKCKL